MKRFNLLFLLLAWASPGFLQASDCYECSSEPLYECSWGLQFQAGVRPIIWHHREHFFTVNCLSDTILNDAGKLPKFSNLYHVPWQIGGQLSYALPCSTLLFVEFNYAQANPKHKDECLTFLTKYKLYDGYFGARYYFDRWCNQISFFIGAKIGFVHHNNVRNISLTFDAIDMQIVPVVSCFFARNTVFAGGGQLGLDMCLSDNWSLVFAAEVVASCGPRAAGFTDLSSLDFLNLDNFSAIINAGVETEIAFPITVGLKYNF